MDIDPLSLFTLVTGGTPGTVWYASKVGGPVPASSGLSSHLLDRAKTRTGHPITLKVMTKLVKSLQSPVTLAYIHRNKHTLQVAWAVYAYDFFTPIKYTGLSVEFTFLAYKPLYVYDLKRNVWPGLAKILIGKLHLTQNQQWLIQIFLRSLPSPVSYRKGKSLEDLLIRARLWRSDNFLYVHESCVARRQ